jgi:hypothetical protein
MRQSQTLGNLTATMFAGLAVLNFGTTARSQAGGKIDDKVVEIVKKTGELYKSAKSFHADADIVSKIENDGNKREINVKAVFDIERPQHLSMKTQVDGDAGKGPDVIADGKKLIVHGKSRKEYVEEASPESMEGIGFRLLQIGPTMTGMLFANVLADDPGDMLMQGVDSCSYVGKDKVGDTPVHRMKFSQEGFDWELWVATEGKPYILRMVRIAEVPSGGKVVTTETYKNWKLDGEFAKDTFTFSAPEGVKKVDDFEEGKDK